VSFPTIPISYHKEGLFRPSSAAFTTLGTGTTSTATHTNDGNAYDTDPNTFATLAGTFTAALSTGTKTRQAIYSGFTGGLSSGILAVLVSTTTEEHISVGGLADAQSSVLINYSIDNGLTWTNFSTSKVAAGFPNLTLSPQSVALFGIDLATLQVQVQATGDCVRIDAIDFCFSSATALVYDITFK